MDRRSRFIAAVIIILALFSILILSACDELGMIINPESGNNGGNTRTPQAKPTPGDNTGDKQETSTKPPADTPDDIIVVLPDIPVPTASGVNVEKNGQAVVDFSNTQDGYIMAKYTESADMKIKLLITVPDGVQYTYSLKPKRDFEVFPLSGGDGTYEIGIYKQVEGTRYSKVLSTTIKVTLTDEFAPFLRPNQYVNFDINSEAVRKAAELTARTETFIDNVSAIYHFVISSVSYDVELAQTVQSDYLPDIDDVMARGKGICFDYASLMAAMLRSQSIPTKLVIGYTGDVYHAWISVYCEEDGWLDNIIFFDGHTWRLVDPTFAANGTSQGVAAYIGDGTNYTVKYLH